MADPAGFREPWEARVFAVARVLRDRGICTAQEWSDALTRHGHWVDALEHLLEEKGLVPEPELERYRAAWRHAAARTPHGQPIVLSDVGAEQRAGASACPEVARD